MKKAFVLAFLLLAVLCSLSAEKVVIKVANMAPDRSPWDISLRSLAQDWYKMTNGDVSLRFINVTTLGGEGGAVKKFRTSRPGQTAPLQGGIFSPIGLSLTAPDSRLFTLLVPFAIRSQEELDAVLGKFGNRFEDAFRRNGFELLTWSNIGWLSFYTKVPVHSLAELKTLRTASGGLSCPELDRAFKLAGFKTESVSIEKLNQSLQSKTGIESFYSVPMYAYAMGYSKNVDYFIDAKLCPVMAGLVVSTEQWNKIDASYRPKLQQSLDAMVLDLNRKLEKDHNDYRAKLIQDGAQPITLSDADLMQWEKDFNLEVNKITADMPQVFDAALLAEIQTFLATYRASKR